MTPSTKKPRTATKQDRKPRKRPRCAAKPLAPLPSTLEPLPSLETLQAVTVDLITARIEIGNAADAKHAKYPNIPDARNNEDCKTLRIVIDSLTVHRTDPESAERQALLRNALRLIREAVEIGRPWAKYAAVQLDLLPVFNRTAQKKPDLTALAHATLAAEKAQHSPQNPAKGIGDMTRAELERIVTATYFLFGANPHLITLRLQGAITATGYSVQDFARDSKAVQS